MKDNLSNIPSELRHQNRWIVWERKGDKKEPYNPRKLSQHADITVDETWADFAFAKRLVDGGKVDGLGYAFKRGEHYTVIDLDHCMTNGKLDSDAQEIVKRMDSYTEISQSGEGLHIICRGEKPTRKAKKGNVEIYNDHFIYLTGNIWEDRKVIEDRQDALDWLCQETFGDKEDAPAEPATVGDLVLDPDREPPEDKLQDLLEDKEFVLLWGHRKKSIPSLSEYDFRLACHAIEASWSDQEMADLLLTFRETHGDKEDRAKGLRDDYIPRTIAKAKATQMPSAVLKSLTFKVVKMLQYGEGNSRFSLVVDENREIDMGRTEDFITPKLANARLLEAGLAQPKRVMDRWLDIIRALQPLKEIIPTTTREDDTRAWLNDYIGNHISLPRIETEDDIKRLFGSGLHSIAYDKQGRIYLRLSDATRYSAVHSGMRGVSSKSVAADLVKIGFKKREIRIKEKGQSEQIRNRQITIWISEPGFIDADKDGSEE